MLKEEFERNLFDDLSGIFDNVDLVQEENLFSSDDSELWNFVNFFVEFCLDVIKNLLWFLYYSNLWPSKNRSPLLYLKPPFQLKPPLEGVLKNRSPGASIRGNTVNGISMVLCQNKKNYHQVKIKKLNGSFLDIAQFIIKIESICWCQNQAKN